MAAKQPILARVGLQGWQWRGPPELVSYPFCVRRVSRVLRVACPSVSQTAADLDLVFICDLRFTIKRFRPRRTRGTDVACPARAARVPAATCLLFYSILRLDMQEGLVLD